jgi:hypothetical protein
MSGKYSMQIMKEACLLGANLTYEEASAIYQEIRKIQVSPDAIESWCKKIGHQLYKLECEHASELLENPKLAQQESSQNVQLQRRSEDRLYLEIDGSHLRIREANSDWKENKMAVGFYESDIKKSGDEQENRLRIAKKDYVSSIGEVGKNLKRFGQLFYGLAVRMGALHAKEVIVIADGADWIRNIVERMLPHAVLILDWYHATENLWSCAKELYGDGSNKATDWVTKYKDLIWNGKIDQVLDSLLAEANTAKNQTPLRKLYGYFANRKESMRYDRFRAKGYHIGSGAIESANKYVVQKRAKQSGMRWSYKGANSIIALRIHYLKGFWNDIWEPGGIAWAA